MLNSHGNYKCHHCGSPENLIVGTLNQGNRLQPWCAFCTIVGDVDTPSLYLPEELHVPNNVVEDVKDVIRNCDRQSSFSTHELRAHLASICGSWNDEG